MAKIVVGVDCSPHSAAALRWAAEDGAAKGVPVVAVMAWSYLDQSHADGGKGEGFDPHWSGEKAKASLDAFVAETLGDGAAGVQTEVINDLPARALLDAAADATTRVVGARGLGGFKGMLVGSVSSKIVHHAPCTVVVARDAD
jgi:nucleotide-binding universal stress UspA family protein